MDTVKWVHFVSYDFTVVTFNPNTVVSVHCGRGPYHTDEGCTVYTVNAYDDRGYALVDSQEFVVNELAAASALGCAPASFFDAETRAKNAKEKDAKQQQRRVSKRGSKRG